MAKDTKKTKKNVMLECVTPNFYGGNGQRYEVGTVYANVPDEIREYFKETDIEIEVEVETENKEIETEE